MIVAIPTQRPVAGLASGPLVVTLFVHVVAAAFRETKVLTRFHDPVMVKTSLLTGLPPVLYSTFDSRANQARGLFYIMDYE